jgi:hypothetical protein
MAAIDVTAAQLWGPAVYISSTDVVDPPPDVKSPPTVG